jgi:hypothetical protein
MTITRKTFFQFLKPLLKFSGGLLHTFLSDILDVEFIITLHADLLDLPLSPLLPDLLLWELVRLSESG